MSIWKPQNEPIQGYAVGSLERKKLKASLQSLLKEKIEIPCIINGKRVWTGKTRKVVLPHRYRHVIAEFHLAGEKEIQAAIEGSLKAKRHWMQLPWQARASVFLKAAQILSEEDRFLLNAATMLGQSKNAFQAEIDAACELIDFFRFNVRFYQEILNESPESTPHFWDQTDYRPLDGFVFAITPFNFTSIAGNLPAAPALCGNSVIWKPSDTQMLAAYYTMLLFEKAGLPPGVIQFLGADGPFAGEVVLAQKELSGIHFTGSTKTFRTLWKTVAQHLDHYLCYPRIVGETGGKDFLFAHPSSELSSLVTALVRGAFEYQGQKCSALSRAYLPKSLWTQVKSNLLEQISQITFGDVCDFSHFMNAVIDQKAYEKIMCYLNEGKKREGVEILFGGKGHSEEGYFIEPTLICVENPLDPLMCEEIFGPVLTIHVYEDDAFEKTLSLCEQNPYGLTGAIFAQDRKAIVQMSQKLRFAAGNFYINDKPTGAAVAQQPFGGSRLSGTNDKAGSKLNLYRWLSPRTIKETWNPPKNWRYPFMGKTC